MISTAIATAAVIVGFVFNVAQQPPAQATATEAAQFIGGWTLALEGPNGPGTFDLVVKVEKEKVVGVITSATMPAQAITDVTKAAKGLVLRYSFDYQGNAVDAVLRLTAAADGKVEAQIDFAGGAYVMSGTATKKDKAHHPVP